jgi:excisionase family DNA binding protein
MFQAELLTMRDLAQILQCHPRTVANLVARNAGPPALRIGGLLRFYPDDVDQWFADLRDAPADRPRSMEDATHA